MTEAPATTSAQQHLLLLGDDGRMASLLSAKIPERTVIAEANVMSGIARLADEPADVVLLNVERLNNKTAQAVHALRQVHPNVRILLFGEAYVEGYAHAALAGGAEDFLVWPVPPGELRRRLDGELPRRSLPRRDRNFFKEDIAPAPDIGPFMQLFYGLAQSVPLGRAALVQQAQVILPVMLGVSQVKIILEEDMAESPAPENTQCIDLPGIRQREGVMQVTPGCADGVLFQEVARCLGTLLGLARRDERLKQLATIDELTGAYNRRYFEHFTRQVLKLSQKERTEATLLVFDIDGFKHFNDTYGHGAGDEILREAARLMKGCCRAHDVVARIGGDEFAVLFWDTGLPRERYDTTASGHSQEPTAPSVDRHGAAPSHPEMVMFMANRFRRLMRTREFPSLGSEARGILTISGGLAGFPWDGDTLESLLARADDALLQAKRAGKNRITLVGHP